mmetsp:Transcript_758/g.1420  ORF Transcript_758/g.1420 Transcript_758/m.1420 type:complete len:327 (-) Transcript_758:228-1208(-)
MYRFLVWANVAPSEHLQLIGGATAVGGWDVPKAVQMNPISGVSDELGYRQWAASVNVSEHGYRYVEYKYIKLREDGDIQWENCLNRNFMAVPGATFEFDDGKFNEPLALPDPQLAPRGPTVPPPPAGGKRVAICGSSVAAGSWAFQDQGWAWILARALEERYNHQTVNVAVHGYDTQHLLKDFQRLVASQKPDYVVIGLSVANEGLSWKPMEEWEAVSLSFKNGIRQLLLEIKQIGAQAVLGDVYPNGDYAHEKQLHLLKDAHEFLASQNVPVLSWLGPLDDGHGRWRDGLMNDPAHPNSHGHRKMFEAIDLSIFAPGEHKSLLLP